MNIRVDFARRLGFAFALGALMAGTANGVSAQDARVLPFEGCWAAEAADGPQVCVRQEAGGAVVLEHAAPGYETASERFILDAERSVEREGCAGIEQARFSVDGRRLMMRSEFGCAGGVVRVESAILTLTAHDELLDVRSVTIDGESVAWVQRYSEAAPSGQGVASPLTVEVARRAASREPDAEAVPDALAIVDASAVEAWLAETGPVFELDARTLVELADRGVPEGVLDVMVAVSNPGRFALAVDDSRVTARRVDRGAPGVGAMGFRDPWGWGFAPWGFGAFGRWSGPLLWNGWAGGWGGGWGGGWAPGWGWGGGVVVVPGDQSEPSSARVVKGRGYTSGRRSTPSGSASAPATGSGSRPAAAPASRPSGSRPAASSGGSSGGSSTGRTAKPRRGGGGGAF